ncbi:uncharacterized protein FRV6_04963 [Fusarium oxysporum]|uniref:C2H2-type domain-containing protein n=1 Tax=Fusarium oxysporum TaxID=5507 RepID=A0A2H3TCR5_FUSOX|nr:uncharacterized protein FRV6_04963 [Fusarium oxysporum]
MSSDTSPIIGATENPPDVNGLPSNFLSIMDITQDRSNTRGRKTGDKTIYTCTVCGNKRYNHKANAANHVGNNHPVASRSTHQVCVGHPALNLCTVSPYSKRGRTSKCLQLAIISGSIDQHTHASESALFGY